ncbi:MAG TPA: hypothetical protein VN442_10615 [Bryobacteraceae bacterium]|nr:hypothetical protein [Bryobacteraceae bacterium]
MIVYREQSRTVPTAEVLARIEAAGNPLERLIEIGELEAGVADALSPDCDRDHPVLAALRRAAIRNEAPRIPGLPETITISVPEGYAYYALYPETYRMAARAFWNEARPARVAVLGIRSIGTSLSAVVAAELEGAGCEVHSWTVRPRGHPFDRRLIAEPELQRRWRELAGAYFAVVDEGPGLSGSSFASVVAALSAAGVPEQRIVLFPSWTPDGSAFVSEAARLCWPRHRKYVASFEDLGMFPGARDLSSGNWRTCIGAEVAVQPQHERRKYLADGRLYKFAGLGRYGRGAFERAQVLAAAGFGPPVEELASGFVSGPWVSGRPLVPGDMTDDLLDVMARYLAFRSREFQCRGGSQLTEMIRVNVEEGLGLRLDLSPPDGHACAIDNRMFPHEWLRTASGYLKTDAVDHYDDHFYPGPQDIAWDLAAAAIEFDMDAEAATALASRYVAHSDDRGIHSRLPFHRLAWLAFRLGYADMAAGALGDTPDGARFRRQRERYAELLLREIRRYA